MEIIIGVLSWFLCVDEGLFLKLKSKHGVKALLEAASQSVDRTSESLMSTYFYCLADLCMN